LERSDFIIRALNTHQSHIIAAYARRIDATVIINRQDSDAAFWYITQHGAVIRS